MHLPRHEKMLMNCSCFGTTLDRESPYMFLVSCCIVMLTSSCLGITAHQDLSAAITCALLSMTLQIKLVGIRAQRWCKLANLYKEPCAIILRSCHKFKSATLEHYALHTSCKFSGNSNTISNKGQESTHDEPLLDQIRAGMREEEAR